MPFKKSFFTLFLCFLPLHVSFASTPKDISFFEDKPKSVAKDFYIYEYLNSEFCSREDAWKLLEHASRMNWKLFHAFASKLDDEGIKKASLCILMKTEELLKDGDRDCIAIGLSVYEATKLDKSLLAKLSKKLAPYKEALSLQILSQENVYESMMQGGNDAFFEVFNAVGTKFRREHFDKIISKEKIEELSKDSRINSTIKHIVTDIKLQKVQKSLLFLNPKEATLNHLSLFYLGLNALKLEKKQQAFLYFEEAYKKAYFQMDKDKVLFWQYLASDDQKYKKMLQESFDLNIYTILAGKKKNNIMIAKAYEPHPFFDEKDPFAWIKLEESFKGKSKEELEALANIYLYGSSLPHFSFIMEKASGYKDHYFPLPYQQFLKSDSIHRKALILSIARQESRFIPSAISTSYALGMMQFMPFLANDIAKRKGFIDFDLEDMFNPETAYLFADIHLDYLEKYLHHPLFVAYAYNGGIGFTKRLLLSGLFQKGRYEPYMSMELVGYDESRRYGKRVLANYIIYRRILQDQVSLTSVFEDLTNPQKTDEFRKKP